jgi:hypothetical protein
MVVYLIGTACSVTSIKLVDILHLHYIVRTALKSTLRFIEMCIMNFKNFRIAYVFIHEDTKLHTVIICIKKGCCLAVCCEL